MKRKIISVGYDFPGGEADQVCGHASKQSLLDFDIILFIPDIPYVSDYGDYYQGKPALSDDSSFQAKEASAHWKREMNAAVDAGKLVIIFLNAPKEVFVATGTREHSGTGRNARVTRHVTSMSSYEALPLNIKYVAASGTEMVLSSKARFLAPYWDEFGKQSAYHVYVDGTFSEILLSTKSGNRIVGACLKKGKGAILAIPSLVENHGFVEFTGTGKEKHEVWTKKACIFGKKLSVALTNLREEIFADSNKTPAPTWVLDNIFRLPDEEYLEKKITETTNKISTLETDRQKLYKELEDAASLRSLLFEQGKPLEHVVIEALNILGFSANPFKEDGSEFDAVFTSTEGRFIGEVEGKDSKAINIDKFSQLERNLGEDFAREEVKEYAKGVLFGNAYRLKKPAEREMPFTEKCITAAKRLNIALVSTPDLFEICRYLKTNNDEEYASLCRQAIFNTGGAVVSFPHHNKQAEDNSIAETAVIVATKA